MEYNDTFFFKFLKILTNTCIAEMGVHWKWFMQATDLFENCFYLDYPQLSIAYTGDGHNAFTEVGIQPNN